MKEVRYHLESTDKLVVYILCRVYKNQFSYQKASSDIKKYLLTILSEISGNIDDQFKPRTISGIINSISRFIKLRRPSRIRLS